MSSKAAVLIVGDGPDDMGEICATIRAAGREVCYACSFAEGVDCLDHESIESVILSQGTRLFEGRSVLVRAIEKDRHLPVLVLTRSLNMQNYLEAMQLGAWDYWEKPVSPEDITKWVSTHSCVPAHCA
jgi:DNA-binding NtrC family response regulator